MARNNHLHNFVYIVVNSRDHYVLSSGYDFLILSIVYKNH